jgi:invasion protein IalB
MGSLGVGTGIARQQPGATPDSARQDALLPESPRFGAEPVATTPASQLLNGASSIEETYGNWAVGCQLVNGRKQCLLAYVQIDGQTRKPLFGIWLQMPRDGKTEGSMLMPFGMKLDAGVILRIDGDDPGSALRFSTCVPQGCLLSVSFPKITIDAMKKSRMLTAASTNLASGEVINFKVPLEGFAAAIARISELGR